MQAKKSYLQENTVTRVGVIESLKKYKGVYLLILPAIILVTVLSYFPMFGIVIAFKDFDIIKGVFGSEWVGFDNFVKVFTQPAMLRAIWNTFFYGIVLVFGLFPFPIILALLFNELRSMKFKKTVQTIAYMPYFLSWISVVGLFYTLFSIEGPINSALAAIIGEGYEPQNILLNSRYFLPILYLTSLWKDTGWSSVVFLAAIVGIDPALYEAATIDGCGKLKQVWHITLPCIKSTAIIVLVMSMGSLVSVNFEQVYGFQNVFTQLDTETINTLIYRRGIQDGEYSLATAFGLSQGLVTMGLVLISNALSKKLAQTSIW